MIDIEDKLGPNESMHVDSIPSGLESKEHAMSLAKYMLSTDIPEELRPEFEHLFLLYDKDYALANIERKDIPYFISSFEFTTLLLDCGLLDYAREIMIQVIQDLKLSRSLDALQLKLGITGIQRSETVTRIEQDKIKRSMGSRIAGAFRGKEKEEL